jgi:putative chitinase
MITAGQIGTIMPNATGALVGTYIGAINDTAARFSIDTPIRQAMFLAQLAHESGELRHAVENLSYSAVALRRVWPGRFSAADAEAYARKPEKIASRAYADRMGNGDEASGDGWRYRGRGLIQITGRDNYRTCGEALDHDFIAAPDDMAKTPWSVLSAGWFWDSRRLNPIADRDDIEAVTRKINGGTNGLDDRKEFYERAKAVLGA